MLGAVTAVATSDQTFHSFRPSIANSSDKNYVGCR